MITKTQIQTLVEEKIAGTDSYIVDITVSPGNQIRILLDSDTGLSIKDCVGVSRHVENNLDRESEDFELQVSSPGLDEPLKMLRQYKKYIGKKLKVSTIEGKELEGALLETSEEGIAIEEKKRERIEGKKSKQTIINKVPLKFEEIKETKVVISFK